MGISITARNLSVPFAGVSKTKKAVSRTTQEGAKPTPGYQKQQLIVEFSMPGLMDKPS